MDQNSIDLKGSEVSSISVDQGTLRLSFSRAYIVRSITGSTERTRWWQAGELVMDGAEIISSPPDGPLKCTGGDIDDNVYTYRNMIPLPLDSRGHTGCTLRFEESPVALIATGRTLKLAMRDVPRYIGHLRPESG